MDRPLGQWTRTPMTPAGSTKRWVAHDRHGRPEPHRVGGRSSTTLDPGSAKGGTVAEGSNPKPNPGPRLVTLDGSKGEGGGQILRTALTLSLLTGRPFRIDRIRANRDKPGLRPQHLAAVQAAAELGHAEVSGALGRLAVADVPSRRDRPRDLAIDIGTAGSTALVLHTLHLPLALRAESGRPPGARRGDVQPGGAVVPVPGGDVGAHLRSDSGLPVAAGDALGRVLPGRRRPARGLDRAGDAPGARPRASRGRSRSGPRRGSASCPARSPSGCSPGPSAAPADRDRGRGRARRAGTASPGAGPSR